MAALRKARAAAEAAQAEAALQKDQASAAKDMGSVKTDERNPVADALTSGTEEPEMAEGL